MSPYRGDPVVGIDASRSQVRERTGTENYSHRIIRGLLGEDVNWCWRLYLNTGVPPPSLPISSHVDLRPIPVHGGTPGHGWSRPLAGG